MRPGHTPDPLPMHTVVPLISYQRYDGVHREGIRPASGAATGYGRRCQPVEVFRFALDLGVILWVGVHFPAMLLAWRIIHSSFLGRASAPYTSGTPLR